MSKVSVIIPIYKVEEYISECIESVLNQTMQDFQLILVDDGSPDQCPAICDKYAKLDERITVIHKENGGLSSARNAAYCRVQSDYLLFLDGDDYLSESALAHLVRLQEAHDADVVIGNYWYLYETHKDVAVQPCNDELLSGYNALKNLVNGNIQNFAWGKLMKTDLVIKHPFPEEKLFEDHYWTHFILAEAKFVYVDSKPILYYRQRASSISYSYTLKRLDMVDGWRARAEYLNEKYPELMPSFLQYISESFVGLAWIVCTRMKTQRKEAISILRNFSIEFTLASHAKKLPRFFIASFQTNTYLFIVLVSIKKFFKKIF